MKHIVHFSLFLAVLSGCDTCHPGVVPLNVKVPVAIPCAPEAVPDPSWNMAQLKDDATDEDRLKAALADLDLAHGYIDELKAELSGCA